MKKYGKRMFSFGLLILNIMIAYFILHRPVIIHSFHEVNKEGSYITQKNNKGDKGDNALILNIINMDVEPIMEPSIPIEPIVYDNLTMAQLADKLERNLNSTVKGYGLLFASYSIQLGIDPYLSVAIMLHETGCKWNCSELVKKCNNVGGMKGRKGCNGSSYQSFSSLEVGIKKYLENLYYNYYRYGLTTPEAMNSKYAESKSWARQVNVYMKQIRES